MYGLRAEWLHGEKFIIVLFCAGGSSYQLSWCGTLLQNKDLLISTAFCESHFGETNSKRSENAKWTCINFLCTWANMFFLKLVRLRDHQQPSSLSVTVPKWHKYTQTILCRHWINIFMIKVFSLQILRVLFWQHYFHTTLLTIRLTLCCFYG